MIVDLRQESRASAPHASDPGLLKDAAIETWRTRMMNEYGSSRVFEALSDQMRRAGFAPKDVAECAKFADEERRHGVLCGAVVESLGGLAVFELDDDCPPLPEHADTTPVVAVLRNAMSVGCLSETVAVSLIGAERIEMPPGELRDLLTTIYADEVGHSRFGWRTLARIAPMLDAGTKERLGEYLEVAFAHLVEHELSHLPLSSQPPAEGAVYGLCSGSDARRLFLDTVEEVIVPGLEMHGIPARRAWFASCASRAQRLAAA